MNDIENRQDIITLVDLFYKKIITDNLIGVFFTKIIDLDWDKHMPVMYDFWENVLFHNAKYKGNPMMVHLNLHQKKTLEPEHFARWLQVWENTIKENFSGNNVDQAIQKAKQIAELMEFKVKSLDK